MGDAGESGLTGQAQDFLQVVREGRSFSGRERHCCFLNLGDGQFADVSAISAFDLPDDGRATALVDWDHDGDHDAWVANRTSPQVRLLLNKTETGNHHLAIRLQGSKSNRDAIGARVEVFLKPDSAPITRTLRAGDAFLAQSSKRLLFGLGKVSTIDRVDVRWPTGKAQSFAGLKVNREYRLVENQHEVQDLPPARSPTKIATGKLKPRTPDDGSQSLCFSMIRLPVRDYEDLRGTRAQVLSQQSRLVLLNLWASWCGPCVSELQEFSDQSQRLRDQRIDVVALCVDDLTEPGTEKGADARLLRQMRFPFRAGRADRSLVERLQLLNETYFELNAPLPVPTSFLLDRKGRVTAVYKGPVTVDRLLADSSKLKARTTEEWRMASLPFSGRWEMPPRRRHLFEYVEQLAERGYFEECELYIRDNPRMLSGHPRWPKLSGQIRDGLRAE